MTAEIINFVELLDEHADRAAAKLGNEPELHCDGGQQIYNGLPRALQRTFVHLAFLMRDGGEWPPADLITSVARYHNSNEDAALVLMGWIPSRALSDLEKTCLELSKQICLGLSFEAECGEPADLTSAVRRP